MFSWYNVSLIICLLFAGFQLASGEVVDADTLSGKNSTQVPESNDGGHWIRGWVVQPSTRGTIDILWTCLFTTFVCTYTILCLNVPSAGETWWNIFGRRIFWMGLAIAGPEFVLTYASGQYGTAYASKKHFHQEGYTKWTLRHGFFADMGGFVLMAEDFKEPFPATGKQLHWLITQGYLDYPETTTREIEDKSKQDTVAKVITCLQIGYIMLQCIGRTAQGIVITTMELSTLAIVVCSILTSLCWLEKPLDVREPIRLVLKKSVGEILDEAAKLDGHGQEVKEWDHTPFDFIDDLGPSWALNVQKFMRMEVSPFERPLPRFGNDRLPNLAGWQECILCVATLGYAAIHLVGWNYTFPTKTEKVLWRVSSMFLFANTAAFWLFETTAAWWRAGRWQRIYRAIVGKRRRKSDVETPLPPIQRMKSSKNLPLPAEFWSIFPLAITYAAARGYLIMEAFIGLRAMEDSAFKNVDWTGFIPHV
ncbi:hypothetical protein TWF694_011001 [Orbilia ellipsospora]|uniref:Uncharacterized protein n=1 Tax=Orbilia ellipsospora TaxID=2528407 RepID=A0AAV9X7Q9_9PEZI